MLPDQKILRIPGPTPIPPSVTRAMSQPMIGHRSEDFKQVLANVAPRLKPIFGTNQDVFILTGSGTSGLETAVVNTLTAGDDVLVIVTGAFGGRFVKISETYNLNVHRIETTWGEAIEPTKVQDYLQQHPTIKAVFATYCETSTAVLNPIKELGQVVHASSDALFIVDGVSCVGAVETQMDKWGVDIMVSGSQKAFMLPTGLSFVAVSERAWKVIEQNNQPRFYLDLKRYRKSLAEESTPFTPAVSLILGLEQVLNLIEEEGLEHVIRRHELMKKMTRAACTALGLPLLTTEDAASPTVTAIQPTTFKADALRSLLKKEFGITLAGGQQHLKGEIFRIGHMGYCSPLDVLQCISAIELGIAQLQQDVELGRGTAAAQEVYRNDI
jgi:aspartate aminotransferase-like enzyme